MAAVTRKKETRGRSELTHELIEQIAEHVRVGVPLKYASLKCGLGEQTVQMWMREADAGCTQHGKSLGATKVRLLDILVSSINEARGDFVSTSTANINVQGKTDWRASSWLLSHQPETKEEYSEAGRVRIEVERHLTVMTTVLQRELAPADFERVLLALSEAQSFQEVS